MATSMDESEDDGEMCLYPPGCEVPLDICERIITKSTTVSQKMLTQVQLDPETLSFLVAREVITDDNATLLGDDSKSHKERIFYILRPALLHGGKKSLEAFYHTLVQTKTSRLGHADLAEDIKKRVGRYLKRVAHERSGHSRSHHPRSKPWEDRMLSYDTDASEVPSGHTQRLFIKQSSLPHDVEPDTRKKTSTFPRQMSEDGRYGRRPTSRPAVGFEYPDSDSSLSSSDSDRRPVVTPVPSSSRSRGMQRKSQSRKLPNILSLLTVPEAKYVEMFRSEHGQVRKSLIEALRLNKRLQDTPTLLAEMLCVEQLATLAGPKLQIGDVVDLWIGKIVKDSSLFGLAVGLARVQGLGRYITCIVQSTGSLTQAELVHFTKALGHSWTIFAQKIGFEEEELKVVGSKQLSKKGFFAKIWLVPKFDKDQVEQLLCELLTAVQQDDVLQKYQSRLSRALDSSDGSKSESDVPSTDTDTDTSTDTDTPAESEAEGPRKVGSAMVIGRNEDTLGTKVTSQSNSGLLSSPGSGSGGSNSIHLEGQSGQQSTALTAQEKKCVEMFRSEHGQVRKSLIEALRLNRRLQDTPAQLAEMLSITDSTNITGSELQIGDVVDLWIGKILKDSSLFGLAMGLARVQGLGRYITCIAQSMDCLAAAELVHFSKALGHSWTIFAQKIGYEAEELKVAGSSKLSKKTFFAKIWLVPKFDDDQVKKLLCELLTTIPELDYVLRNFRNRLSRGENSRHGISALDTSTSTFTMSLLDAPEGSRSESDVASTDTETETETETETPSESESEGAKKDVSAAVVGQNCDSLGAKAASQSNSGLVSAPSSGSAAWSMVNSLSASSLPPTWEEPEDSSKTLLDPGDWSSSAESGFDQGFSDEEDVPDISTVQVYDKTAIFFGPDIVAPPMSKRSEIAGMYKLLKGQPFEQDLFEAMLVSEPSLVNRLTKDDRSLLFLACELNNAEAVTLLLKNGANPNLQDKYGRTCLHILSVYWNEIILWALLQNESINVNVATFKTQATPLCVACLMKDVTPVKRLLDKGASPNGAEETTCPPIVLAAREGAGEVVMELLARGAQADKPTTGGYTALHMAAFDDNTQMVEILLAHNSDPNHQASNCATPLSCAVANGHVNTARILLDSGANVNAIRTITHDGALAGSMVSALAEAALGGHADVVMLMLEANADLNFKSGDYLSVLAYACIGGSADVVRQLMIYGDMKSRPSELVIPLQSAMQYENYRCAQVLVEEAGGVEALRRAHHYDTQLLQDLNTISALLSSGEMMNMGDGVPKSVGRNDDEFQKYRSRSLYATIEEVKVAQLFDPNEAMVYEGLVQYIVEKHIIITAELMTGEQNLLAMAEDSGANEVADFIRQYRANLIAPAELSHRLNSTMPPVVSFFCRHVDLVHLQQYARSTDNRIALQYFLEMQRRRDMGHLTGFGLQMIHYGTPFDSGLDSHNLAGLQAGMQQGLSLGSHGMTLGHGLQGGRPLGAGPILPSRQGLSSPRTSLSSTGPGSRDSTPVTPKSRHLEVPFPPKAKDALSASATPLPKEPKVTAGDATMPKKTAHSEGSRSNDVSAETIVTCTSAEPSHSYSSATQPSQNDSEDELTVTEEDRPSGAQFGQPFTAQHSQDSGIVADSDAQKRYKKGRRRVPEPDTLTSEDDTKACEKRHRKNKRKRENDTSGNSSCPDSSGSDGSGSETESICSSIHPVSMETLKSVEPSSSVVQGPTLEVPPVSLPVNQRYRADSPPVHTPLARAASSDSKEATAEVDSPVPPDKTSRQSTDKLQEEVPPPYAADTTVTVDPSSNDNALLLGKCNPQQESTVTEAAEAVMTVMKTADENVKTGNIVNMTDETRADAGNGTEEDATTPHSDSVSGVSKIHHDTLESTLVPHEMETPKQEFIRVPLASPGHTFILVQGIPNEAIDRRRYKDKLLLSKVGSSVKQRWSMLARHLGLLEEDVQNIKETCDTSEGRGMEVVFRWLHKTSNPTGSESALRPPTWHQLAVCLECVRRHDLVCQIRSRLRPVQITENEKQPLSGSDIIDINSPHHLRILMHVAMSMAEKWALLAKCLRVSKDSVGPCDAYNDSTSVCYSVLILWLSEQQGKEGTTFEVLFAHLRNMDCDHLIGEALLIGSLPSESLGQPF